MWPIVAFLLTAALVALHLWWSKRYQAAVREVSSLQKELATLSESNRESLAEVFAQQQALFNSMVEGVLLVDENGRIELINQALTRLIDVPSEIKGKTILEAFRLQELNQVMAQVQEEGKVLDYELELPGVKPRWLQVNASAIHDPKKRLKGAIVVFHDLTRLKQLESTRKEFVANVSHELRTPLSLIKGYVETLIDGAKDDPAVASRFLNTILKHTDRFAYLIEDLLTISQLESGQTVMNMQAVDLRCLAARVLDDLESRARAKKVALKNEVPTDMTVRADSDRLQQVLFNLIDNAIKYSRPDGAAVVVTARLKNGGVVEVSVQDNGPGIPEEQLDRVFERFYRVDKARSREQGGTGLGLSIVKHIVQSHKGEVWAKSRLGEGATFFFTLRQE